MDTKYKEIEKELESVENEDIKRAFNAFAKSCQRYYYLFQINEMFDKKVKRTLECCMDRHSSYYLTKKRGNQIENKDSMDSVYIEFEYKIYAGVLQYVYDKYYKNAKEFSWEKTATNINYIAIIIAEQFPNMPEYLKKGFLSLPSNIYMNSVKKRNFNNIVNAMTIVKKTTEITVPTIEESVEDLIFPQLLDTMVAYLKNNELIWFYFTVAHVTKELTHGSCHKHYDGNRSNNEIFFNLKTYYNIDNLEEYLNTIYDLYERYTLIISEFTNIL
mgnify:CR=1 FL=1